MSSRIAVLKTSPENIIKDYSKLMDLAEYRNEIKNIPTLLKLNLSWSMYFPSCSTQPWQLEGVLKKLTDDGYNNLYPVENRTVVTDVWKGAKGNKWLPVLEKYGQKLTPLTDVEWVEYMPKAEMMALNKIFSSGYRSRSICKKDIGVAK